MALEHGAWPSVTIPPVERAASLRRRASSPAFFQLLASQRPELPPCGTDAFVCQPISPTEALRDPAPKSSSRARPT